MLYYINDNNISVRMTVMDSEKRDIVQKNLLKINVDNFNDY